MRLTEVMHVKSADKIGLHSTAFRLSPKWSSRPHPELGEAKVPSEHRCAVICGPETAIDGRKARMLRRKLQCQSALFHHPLLFNGPGRNTEKAMDARRSWFQSLDDNTKALVLTVAIKVCCHSHAPLQFRRPAVAQ